MGRFERPDAAHQPVLESQVVGQSAEQRLAQVHVRLDEPRHDQTAAAIANLGLGVGPLPPSLVPLPRLPDRLDSPFAHRHIRPQHAPGAVVQEHVAAGEPQVGHVWPRGVR